MPEIQAFRAIRYDLGHVGSLGDVVAPPYDAISPELQEDLYRKHPCNMVRLILNRKEPGDTEADNCYLRARDLLRNWRSEGVLFTEADPALYVYHQQFTVGRQAHTRRGFIARLRLSRFGWGEVFPHKTTRSAVKIDRLMLITTCKANLSPVLGLYPDPDGEAQNLLERAVAGGTPIEAADPLGATHRLWPVTNPEVIASVVGAMGPKPIFLADGHHRYETACDYRAHLLQAGGLDSEHPANFVMMTCVAMEDPGLIALPTHRLFQGLPAMTAEELIARLGDYFETRPAGRGPEGAVTAWEDLETGDDQGAVALCTQADRQWVVAQLTGAGRERLARIAADCDEDARELGASIIDLLIVRELLGATDPPPPRYVHSLDDVIEGLRSDAFPLAALVLPATVEHLRAITLRGHRLPEKSTCFYPDLLSGLVINPLE
jgi:uncharacterized protein (DUF1015 family)